MAIVVAGVGGLGEHTSAEERNIEWLRRQAYKEVALYDSDLSRIDKIIEGIKQGKIQKYNFWDGVRKLTRRVKSDRSIRRWQIIAEWFDRREYWF